MNVIEKPLPATIVFARHGRYAHNVRLEQTGDAAMSVKPMTLADHQQLAIDEVGKQQAEHLGTYLRSITSLAERSVAMCSDYKRTYTTAITALPELEHGTIITETALRERSWGEIGDIPGSQFRARWPERAEAWNANRTHWLPPGGETLFDKALDIQNLLPTMGEIAPDQTFLAFTSGEAAIATLAAPLLGRMGNAALLGTYPNNWTIYEMQNCQTLEYTRRNPQAQDAPLRPTFEWARSTRAGEPDPKNTGWMKIEDLL